MTEAKPLTAADRWIGLPLLIALVGPFVVAYQAWSTGYILTRLWSWYAVPLGLPAIASKAFIALWLARRVLRGFPSENEPVDSRTPREKYMQGLLSWAGPWILLLVGWWLR